MKICVTPLDALKYETRREGFIWLVVLERIWSHVGEDRRKRWLATLHHEQEAKKFNSAAHLFLYFLFSQSGTEACRKVPPTLTLVLPSSAKQFWKHPYRYTQKLHFSNNYKWNKVEKQDYPSLHPN